MRKLIAICLACGTLTACLSVEDAARHEGEALSGTMQASGDVQDPAPATVNPLDWHPDPNSTAQTHLSISSYWRTTANLVAVCGWHAGHGNQDLVDAHCQTFPVMPGEMRNGVLGLAKLQFATWYADHGGPITVACDTDARCRPWAVRYGYLPGSGGF